MVAGILLGLGTFRFSVATAAFDQLQRKSEWRWGSVERIGRPSALQYLGPGGDEITLQGMVYPHVTGGNGQIEAMVAMAGKGEPLTLVAGSGTSLGRWCIASVDRTHIGLFQDGEPRKQTFSLSLKAYGEDATGAGAAGIVAKPAAAAAAPISFGQATAAVSQIAPQIASVGLSQPQAAATVVGMSQSLAGQASGTMTDLAKRVATPALTAIGMPPADIREVLGSTPVKAVVQAVNAMGAAPSWLRSEVINTAFGGDSGQSISKLVSASSLAKSLGKPWMVV